MRVIRYIEDVECSLTCARISYSYMLGTGTHTHPHRLRLCGVNDSENELQKAKPIKPNGIQRRRTLIVITLGTRPGAHKYQSVGQRERCANKSFEHENRRCCRRRHRFGSRTTHDHQFPHNFSCHTRLVLAGPFRQSPYNAPHSPHPHKAAASRCARRGSERTVDARLYTEMTH